MLYYAKASWYIRTTARRDEMVAGNRAINWYPAHVKEGRFGGWLKNNVDWAVSRERYWGTPIPIWRCADAACAHEHCVGSAAELAQLATPETQALVDGLDLHRPYVDRVELACPHCGGAMRRVPEVADAWFDSGAMPFAQWNYPVTLPRARAGRGRAGRRGRAARKSLLPGRLHRGGGGPDARVVLQPARPFDAHRRAPFL